MSRAVERTVLASRCLDGAAADVEAFLRRGGTALEKADTTPQRTKALHESFRNQTPQSGFSRLPLSLPTGRGEVAIVPALMSHASHRIVRRLSVKPHD